MSPTPGSPDSIPQIPTALPRVSPLHPHCSPYPTFAPFASPEGSGMGFFWGSTNIINHYSDCRGGGGYPVCDKFWLGDTEAPGPALACCGMTPGLEISAEIPEGRWKTPPTVTPRVSLCDSRAVPSPGARFPFQKGKVWCSPHSTGERLPQHGELGGFGVTHVPSSLLSLSHPTDNDSAAKPTC